MYVLDLGLDRRCADIPVKHVPWNRFADVLQQRELNSRWDGVVPAGSRNNGGLPIVDS
jgi:hypothetical protein